VPPEWVFQDEGYSGAILVRPGLEALRDLAAEGQIAAVLINSPDRLSRKYAYQVLLSEELSRCGSGPFRRLRCLVKKEGPSSWTPATAFILLSAEIQSILHSRPAGRSAAQGALRGHRGTRSLAQG